MYLKILDIRVTRVTTNLKFNCI